MDRLPAGQALGTAVAEALHTGRHIADVDVAALQQTLMEDDCYIPWHERTLPALTKEALCSAEVLRNGRERGAENLWIGKAGEVAEYRFAALVQLREIRLVFDSDLNRKYHNMPCCYPLEEKDFHLPQTLMREYRLEGVGEDGELYVLHVRENRHRLVRHAVDWRVRALRLVPIATHECEEFRVFEFEVK